MDTKHREERKRYIRISQSDESVHIYQEEGMILACSNKEGSSIMEEKLSSIFFSFNLLYYFSS